MLFRRALENGLYSGVLEGQGQAVGEWLSQTDFEERLLNFFPAARETSLTELKVRIVKSLKVVVVAIVVVLINRNRMDCNSSKVKFKC